MLPVYSLLGLCPLLLDDVERMLRLGQRCVLRALLATRKIFAKSESKYLLNRLWIDDYCVWLQSPEADGRLKRLAERYAVARAALDKSDFPKWKLPMIEKCFADMRIVAAAEAAAAQESGTESSSASSSFEGESESEDESGGGEDDGGDGRDTSDDRGAAEEKIDDLHTVAEAPTPVAVPPGAGAGEEQAPPQKKVLIEEL